MISFSANRMEFEIDGLTFIVEEHFPMYHVNDPFNLRDIDVWWERDNESGPIFTATEVYSGELSPHIRDGDLEKDFISKLPLYKKALDRYKKFLVFK